jgi:uncharacterized protein
METYKLSYYTILSDVLDEDAPKPQRIIYASRTGRAAILFEDQLEKMKANNFSQVPMQVLSGLIEMEAIVPASEDELDFLLENNQAAIDDNKVLGFTVQPGASCQLGCGYCGQKHTKDYMDANLSAQMLTRIREKTGHKPYEELAITWYGGEPLMALKQLRELSPKLIALAEEKGLFYSSNMVTNGLSLKEDIYDELVNTLRVTSFQITLDGLAEYHDNRRFTKEGQKATFDIIFNNILNIVSREDFIRSGVEIAIRCNADKENMDGILPFINHLAAHKLQDKIHFYVAPIHDWGDNNVMKNQGISKDELPTREIDWMMELIRLNFKTSILPERKQIVCMVVDPDAEVYDAFGNVSTCWEIPYTPVYENTAYVIGNLKQPEKIQTEDITMRNWNKDIRLGKTWCKTCQFLPVCGGSCPKNWLEGQPPCPTFKYNMADRLILQYVSKNSSVAEFN